MNDSTPLPALDALKNQAKRLRARLAEDGDFLSHSETLELIARQYGYRDWNTIHAACGNRPRTPVAVGAQVSGHYLGQPFTGEVIGVQKLSDNGRARITLDFHEPVDVVKFDSFSAFRKRVSCVIGADGRTAEKTSDGQPQMILSL
ncbi:MAG: hypothetical protein H2040_03735 [Euryhalocaulis sp.]|uniref:glyoxalase superfamily protein n=1 Tax=Euryhalocaulis sp. TaxID=2744307 RepID=UPI0017F621CD|nr:glyoxalase superfamily protein [Euryhalocaulis sp.]MBA4800950.1 hypothetical protein [Euryhalocaulis sp.]